MTNLYFANCTTPDECKKTYKSLYIQNCKDAETMQQINEALKIRLNDLQTSQPAENTAPTIQSNTNQEQTPNPEKLDRIKAAQMFAASFAGVNAEITGLWVWATGETKENKDKLAAYGFRYSHKKQAWYFHTMPFFKTKHPLTLPQIREKYGTQEQKTA